MGLQSAPSSERVHIGIFGKRNAGKSSVLNAITNQKIAIVSDIKGTTTDPVYKSMELLPLGPVIFIDTPGLDDEGELGELRMQKGLEVLRKTDLALLVVDGRAGMSRGDLLLEKEFQKRQISYLILYNKGDLVTEKIQDESCIWISAKSGEGIKELKEQIAHLLPQGKQEKRLAGDLLAPMDFVVLVIPIDKAAPKGRLILPQQQVIRDILEAGAISVVVKDTELKETLRHLGKKPKLVITDSQVFEKANAVTPGDVWLTSFSILFARDKGNLEQVVKGTRALKSLQDGDKILISEGCTHHRQCNDIGTVKLPHWIRKYTGKHLEFHFTSGVEFEQDLTSYHMIVHCGGCMLNEREMQYRLKEAERQGIPVTNYGILIACMKGILERSLEPFSQMAGLPGDGEKFGK